MTLETALHCATAVSLLCISAVLYYFARRKPDLPLRWLVFLVALVLTGLGSVYLVGPGPVHLLTQGIIATVSVLTAASMLVTYPRAKGLRSPVEAETFRLMLERDIAERQKATDRLIRAASFPEQNPNPFFQTDLSGNLTYANPEAERRFPDLSEAGLRHPAMQGMDTVMQEFRVGKMEGLTRVIDCGDGVFQQKICYLLQRGQLAVYMTDITDLRRTQEGLRTSQEQYRRLFEEAPVAYHEIDRRGVVTRVNEAECALLGLPAAEILGRPVWSLVVPEEQVAARREVAEKMSGSAPLTPFSRTYVRRDGTRPVLEIHENFIRDADGAISGIRAALLDVTERLRAEEESRRLRETAEAASRAKSDFVANMSHEVRTPLNAIQGMTELTLTTGVTAEQKEYLGAVKSAADSLLTVINDILDFSKIEAGKLELDPIDFRLRDTVEDALGVLALRAQEKKLELTYRVSPQVPDDLVGDPGRLRQVLLNLIGNALKFTARGEVAVSVGLDQPDAKEPRLHFHVRDTGIGIPPEKIETIFDAFQQADSSTTRRYGGTGLGLTISTRLVQLMDGRIWVESRPGAGSTFHFTAVFGAATKPVSRSRPALPAASVLVVDDNTSSREALQETLGAWDLAAAGVDQSEAGWLEVVSAREQQRPYSLLLIDADLGEMDGFTLAERILLAALDPELPPSRRTAILMLLSAGQLGQVARCLELGLSYVVKPVRHDALLAAVGKALGVAPEPAGALLPGSGRTREARPLRLLVAEDHPVNQLLARRLLERRGHSVTVADNGREALAAIEQNTFDLVLMDVQMPEMDGLQATAAIRRREQTTGGRLPIVAMTAHAMRGDRERCLEAGMDGYLSKPIEQDELFRTMDALTGSGGAPPTAPAPRRASEAILDYQQLLGRLGGSTELLQEIAGMFQKEYPKLLERAAQALAARDAVALHRAAHTFKGVLRNLAAGPAADLALRLEEAGRKADFTAAAEIFAELTSGVEQLEHALKNLYKETAHEDSDCRR